MRSFAVLLVVAGLALACGKTSVRPSWRTDVTLAMADARAEGRPALLFLDAKWDMAEPEYDQHTFTDPRVVGALDDGKVMAVRAEMADDDAPGVRALAEQYKVVGLPTLIFFDADGAELTRFNEYMPPEKLAPQLRDLVAKSRYRHDHPLRW